MLAEMGKSARNAFRKTSGADSKTKNLALYSLATLIEEESGRILAANNLDVEAAREAGMNDALIDRLTLSGKRLQALSSDLRKLADLPDPVGETFDKTVLPNGLKLCRKRVPLGIIGVIYESRPNVTVEAVVRSAEQLLSPTRSQQVKSWG